VSEAIKILVTGANGQLGKEIRSLAASFPGFEFVFLSRTDLPIHHFPLVRTFFDTVKPAYCINCAAYTAVDRAEDEKDLAFQVNGESVGVLAAVCKEHNTRFIHISTDYVYDGNGTKPYLETDKTDPINVYGASKLDGENQALKFNPESIIIRTSWVYSEFGKNFVKTMLELMATRDQISVVNDQIGSPTYAADLAEAILQIIESDVQKPDSTTGGIYHYSNEGVISWFDFAVAIKEISGSECKINPIHSSFFPTKAKRPNYSVLDKSKIRSTFNLQLKDWRKSLAVCIAKLK
jgi:dTDP-4-dehydrorhamnose reductase